MNNPPTLKEINETREAFLESIILSMYNNYIAVREEIAFITDKANKLDDLNCKLFNLAEVPNEIETLSQLDKPSNPQ